MVGRWPHRAFTFRALSKTYGQMWLRCDVCRRYARLKLAGLHDVDYRTKTEKRPPPSYEERMAVFSPSGRPEPSQDPFLKGSSL
jgi:hypothetical protein